MKNYQIDIKTEVEVMRKKLMMVFSGVTLCVALASNPQAIQAEDAAENLDHRVSLRERMDMISTLFGQAIYTAFHNNVPNYGIGV